MTQPRMMLMRKSLMILYKDLKRWVPLAFRCSYMYISSQIYIYNVYTCMHVRIDHDMYCKCSHNATLIKCLLFGQ